MICKHCGAEGTIKTICNMKGEVEQYICTDCGCTSDVLENMKDDLKGLEMQEEEIKEKKADLKNRINIRLGELRRLNDKLKEVK